MAMTYEESSQLMVDMTFRGRVKVAALKYADSILNEAASVAGHTSRVRWATLTFQTPDNIAQQIQPPVVMDPAIQNAGAAIDDAALQAAVEITANKMM